ncbi:PREDICTED: golgin subfamily A member 6-like protein 1 isoform X2 [Rhagoletis zephyria]|uniref:golgin subfamily A member 6-like protein 1 isoform X2 n=1 Tax=Rhagoletis zephyria TaxID=28612 RepID=UPI00081187BD|nr:PREDICTED: golgin subfamily A member 6-like protein 1 isoform X2 [Rhagoletis zephyria]
MERDLDKTHHSGFMNDLLGRSDISENVNALQKIRELEGMVTQSEEKMHSLQSQVTKLEEIIAKRDETIKEYEEKVKELAFQNAELLEMMENKEKDMANVEPNERIASFVPLLANYSAARMSVSPSRRRRSISNMRTSSTRSQSIVTNITK